MRGGHDNGAIFALGSLAFPWSAGGVCGSQFFAAFGANRSHSGLDVLDGAMLIGFFLIRCPRRSQIGELPVSLVHVRLSCFPAWERRYPRFGRSAWGFG